MKKKAKLREEKKSMYISECMSYEDIEATLQPEKGGIYISLDSSQMHLMLILNYTQMKTLADACQTLFTKVNLQEFIEGDDPDLNGALRVKFVLPKRPEETESETVQAPLNPPASRLNRAFAS